MGHARRFQSFWVNGLLWKKVGALVHIWQLPVSILLGQWITLEDIIGFYGVDRAVYQFQSFWVNGLLWKLP